MHSFGLAVAFRHHADRLIASRADIHIADHCMQLKLNVKLSATLSIRDLPDAMSDSSGLRQLLHHF